MNPILTRNYTAGAALTPYRIVKPGPGAGQVQPAAAATDKLLGVLDIPGAVASGQRADVMLGGLADVEYGGTVAEGDPLTADALGRAVVAAPAAGSNVRIVGIATVAGVAGDIGSALLSPGLMQG